MCGLDRFTSSWLRGGGSSSSNPPPVANADPGGIYTGTLFPAGPGIVNVIGIVTETGDVVVFDTRYNYSQFAGSLSVSGDSFSSTLTEYAPFGSVFQSGESVAQLTMSGTINQGVSISGAYSGGDSGGDMLLTNDPRIYNQVSALSSLTGTWEGMVADGSTLTFTIQSDGSYFGQSTYGCTFTGNFSIINPDFNTYSITVNNTCANGGHYNISGLSFLGVDSSTNKRAIFFGASNSHSQISITGELQQQ